MFFLTKETDGFYFYTKTWDLDTAGRTVPSVICCVDRYFDFITTNAEHAVPHKYTVQRWQKHTWLISETVTKTILTLMFSFETQVCNLRSNFKNQTF